MKGPHNHLTRRTSKPGGNRRCDMIEHDIALLNDSFERCTARSRFLDRFYDLFLASSKEVAEKFSRTDFRKQRGGKP